MGRLAVSKSTNKPTIIYEIGKAIQRAIQKTIQKENEAREHSQSAKEPAKKPKVKTVAGVSNEPVWSIGRHSNCCLHFSELPKKTFAGLHN